MPVDDALPPRTHLDESKPFRCRPVLVIGIISHFRIVPQLGYPDQRYFANLKNIHFASFLSADMYKAVEQTKRSDTTRVGGGTTLELRSPYITYLLGFSHEFHHMNITGNGNADPVPVVTSLGGQWCSRFGC